jgi:arsenate reductase
MAEALLRLFTSNHFDAFSAGTHPAGLNPYAIEAMQEIGVNISNQRSKHVNEFVRQPFDYVITVCDQANESCPFFLDARNMRHWSFEDPAAAPSTIRREVFLQVRDEIADRICKFLIEEAEITPPALKCYRCSG